MDAPETPGGPVSRPDRMERLSAVVAGAILGVMVGVVGTVFHRTSAGAVPVGVAAGLVVVGAGATFLRALDGRAAAVWYAAATLAGIAALALVTPGADRILLPDAPGLGWAIGTVAVLVISLSLPDRMFGE